MDEKDTAYIAGFVDGEGCLSIGRSHKKDPKYKNPVYALSLKVGQTQREILDWIQEKLEVGNVVPASRARNSYPNRKFFWQLQIYGKAAERVVRLLQSHLKVKQAQVKVALEFAALPKVSGIRNEKGHQIPVPPKVQSERERLYWEMRKLNSGVVK